MKEDDGVGPYVASILGGQDAEGIRSEAAVRVQAIDCGTTPENHTSTIRRVHPDVLVIVDAAEMGLAPGDCRIIPVEQAGALGLSTHSMPLSLFASYVREMAGSIVLIGVQPRRMAFGVCLSGEVRQAGQALASMLLQGRLGELDALD